MPKQEVPNFIEKDGEILPNNEGTSSENINGAVFPGRGKRDREMPHDFTQVSEIEAAAIGAEPLKAAIPPLAPEIQQILDARKKPEDRLTRVINLQRQRYFGDQTPRA